MNQKASSLVMAAGLLLGRAESLTAQAARDSLIREARAAYDDFQTGRAIDLLTFALDPTAGPADSVWASGALLLAQIHVEEDRQAVAHVWLSWAVRVAPNAPYNTVAFISGVATTLGAARESVRPAPGDPFVRTSWTWRPRGSADQAARALVQAQDPTVPLSVLITGRGLIAPGQPSVLPAGTYEFQATAPGYLPVRVTREVLPGITTVLTFAPRSEAVAALDSVLSPDVASANLGRVVRLAPEVYGVAQPPCGTGVTAGTGLVITSYAAIRGSERITVQLPGARRVTDGVRIVTHDRRTGLAVLQVPGAPGDSLGPVAAVSDSQFAWALGFRDCASASAVRYRVAAGPGTDSAVSLGAPATDGQRGALLIDRAGSALALVTGGARAVPILAVRPILAQARATTVSGTAPTPLEFATRENHRYGTLALSAPTPGAVARIRPLEAWHWPELAREAPLPVTFAGPAGRYQVDLVVQGQSQSQATAEIRPGTTTRLVLGRQIVRRRGFPWPIALLGVGAAGGAAFLLLGGGDGGGGTGGISVQVPIRP